MQKLNSSLMHALRKPDAFGDHDGAFFLYPLYQERKRKRTLIKTLGFRRMVHCRRCFKWYQPSRTHGDVKQKAPPCVAARPCDKKKRQQSLASLRDHRSRWTPDLRTFSKNEYERFFDEAIRIGEMGTDMGSKSPQ
jgi:hypothetical protein